MRKIITFLGIYPKLTHYDYQGNVYAGRVFPEAMRQFLDFDQMLVFVTEEAAQNAFPVLAELRDERILPVNIPRGENSAEMWTTFEAITGAVDQGDQVIFDITHSLRSIPFLVFLAAAFLKSAKQVTIEAIYYGAFELQKDPGGNERPAPVIELSEFVSLLDWMSASEQFIRLGDAKPLAEQLRKTRPAHEQQQADSTIRAQSVALSQAATALDDVSRGLRLILPDRAMEASEHLQGHLAAATGAIAQWARPFAILSRQVAQAYLPLALAHPKDPHNFVASLNRERALIQWYIERNLLAQAIATAREWLLTWGLLHAGYTRPYDRAIRADIIERAFNEANYQRQGNNHDFDDHCFMTGVCLKSIPAIDAALDLYREIGRIRNILMHAGKQPADIPAETLERKAIELCQRLDDLPLPSLP